MSHLNFTEKVKFSGRDCIITYFGKNFLGENFFCYIRCNIDGYRKMKDDFTGKSYRNPTDYGEIIYRDNISEPDKKAKEFLKNWMVR